MKWCEEVLREVNRLAYSQGHELAPHGATAVSITPGWLRSEMMLENFGVTESNWREALDPARAQGGQPVAPPDFALSESPRYVGRAIVSLALDPDRARWNQQSISSGELARVYGFTDVDGTSPHIWRHMEESPNNRQLLRHEEDNDQQRQHRFLDRTLVPNWTKG